MNEPIENYSRALPMDVRSRPPQSTRAASRLRALAFHSAGDGTCGLRSPRGAGAPGRSRCPLLYPEARGDPPGERPWPAHPATPAASPWIAARGAPGFWVPDSGKAAARHPRPPREAGLRGPKAGPGGGWSNKFALLHLKRDRSHRDLNLDRWIQSPECSPLHHGTHVRTSASAGPHCGCASTR